MHPLVKKIDPDELRSLVEEIQNSPVVDYKARLGGVCPICKKVKCRVTNTAPWMGKVRERFHKCGSCGLRFKSVETD
ncbi:MAG: hypothetical protein ACNI27_12825 [Desulfovibrio sp.]